MAVMMRAISVLRRSVARWTTFRPASVRLVKISRRLAGLGSRSSIVGAARAPITAVIIMFELTGEYSVILPLM
ncbi:chloride channel protein, partial [Streptomyces sp. NPDC054933]